MSLSEEIVFNTVVEQEVSNNTLQPQLNQAKLVKRTALVCKNINEFMLDFLDDIEIRNEWNKEENQQKLRLITNEKKIKCKKDDDTEEDIKRKAERREHKKAENVVKKAEKQINKLKGRPKSAYYYFAIDEKPKVLLENPEWNNNKDKKKIFILNYKIDGKKHAKQIYLNFIKIKQIMNIKTCQFLLKSLLNHMIERLEIERSMVMIQELINIIKINLREKKKREKNKI